MSEQPHDNSFFRAVIGALAMITAIGGFAALFVVRVPPENKDAMMFALGAVFGWAGSIVASEYGASTTGRKIAETAVRTMERQTIANEFPTEPAPVTVVNASDNPVPTKDQQ